MRTIASLMVMGMLAGSAAAQATSPVSFPDLLQSICMKTKAEPAAVEQAMRGLGGTPTEVDLSDLPNGAAAEKAQMWDVTVQGHKFLVGELQYKKNAPSAKASPSLGCVVVSFDAQKIDLDAFIKMVGVTPLSLSKDDRAAYIFAYTENNGVRSPVQLGTPQAAADIAAGNAVTLTLVSLDPGLMAMITRIYPQAGH